ncbi:MAG TPA: hypothetical protein VM557_09280 [Thermoanaerobaculia bacterium]|nr:hypothetical protein [Thermoanaerobaculia bacterium]
MTDQPLQTERYRIAGEGKDLYSRNDLRNRIRNGSLLAGTEVALEGTDEYRPAADFPELARYFSLISSAPRPVEASTYVPADSVAPATSVGARLIPGLIYPLTGFGAVVVFGLALLQLLPFGFLASAIAMPLVSVAIVRVSSEGSTRMPALAAFGSLGEMVMTALKAIAISLLSAWPLILAMILSFLLPGAAFTLAIAAMIAMVLYYPACIAILAKYKTIRPALSVSLIWGFITTLGADYALAIGAGLGVLGLLIVLSLFASTLPANVGALLTVLVVVWGTLYVFHLIGWAMYRHRDEI